MKRILCFLLLFLTGYTFAQGFEYSSLLNGEYVSDSCMYNTNAKIEGQLQISSSDSSDTYFLVQSMSCNTKRNYSCKKLIPNKGYELSLILDVIYQGTPEYGVFKIVNDKLAFVISKLNGYDEASENNIWLTETFFKVEPVDRELLTPYPSIINDKSEE